MPKLVASDSDDILDRGAKQSFFLNNLEQWIDEVISQDGLADRELVKRIKESFERSIQANVDYHKSMMNSARENDEEKMADRHRLMAEIYQSLLKR